jgi:PAS domain S-box-containing protein
MIIRRPRRKLPPIGLKFYVWSLVLAWTGCIVASLGWNLHKQNQETLEVARTSARVAYQKDVLYREWNARHGGVYAPVSDETPSNPYLKGDERDIETVGGRALTLLNPAYMTRQVYEIALQADGVYGHITSLKPIRPENAPDPWEVRALKQFEEGAEEVSSVEDMEGRSYMRLMRPLLTKKVCLRCHAEQGYALGDVRGGISVAIPMAPLWLSDISHKITITLGHGVLWLLGLAGIWLGTARLLRQIRRRRRAEDDLVVVNSQLKEKNRQLGKAIERANDLAVKTESAYEEVNQIFNAAADGLCVINTEFEVQRINKTFADLLKIELSEAQGKKCHELFGSDLCHTPRCPMVRVIGGERRVEDDVLVHNRDGESFPCILTVIPLMNPEGAVIGMVTNFRDMTDRKRAEAEKIRREKLQGVLEMAGAVCHELNQPIQSASGYSELLLMDLPEGSPLTSRIHSLKEQVERMGDITGKLMNIARYKTKDYVGGGKIIDIDKASEEIRPGDEREAFLEGTRDQPVKVVNR